MGSAEPLLIGLLGALIVLAVFLHSGLRRAGVPALVGYMALGLVLRVADGAWPIVPEEGFPVLEILARLGIIALLFRVGLESDVGKLRDQLARAGPIWLGSVLVSGLAGFAAARWLLGFALIPSLFTAVALTATSVGVTVGVWREAGAMDSEAGALLLDTVELDDFSGVLLMAVLFGIAPALHQGAGGRLAAVLAGSTALVLLKAGAFLVACLLFARYGEQRLTNLLDGGGVGRTLLILGTGLIIAAVAEGLGLSFAIGAFFAGLVFSRDPESVKIDASFDDIYELLVPFFFIWLGFGIDPGVVGPALAPALVLLAAAVLGKVLGTGLPALPAVGAMGGLALGVSVVPRAEIMMVVMERGLQLGEWAVSPRLFGAAVGVVLVTSAVFPVITRRILESTPGLRE